MMRAGLWQVLQCVPASTHCALHVQDAHLAVSLRCTAAVAPCKHASHSLRCCFLQGDRSAARGAANACVRARPAARAARAV
jgi:hypothetical protein